MTKLLEVPYGILHRRQFEHHEDFDKQPDTFVMPLETVTAGANANDDVVATLVGVVPRASKLLGGYLCASANSAGIDANNTSAWVVTAAGTTALSKTNSADLVADTPVSFGTPIVADIAAGSAIKLAITNGTNADLNTAACHASLILADALNYPAPGFKVIATDNGSATVADGAHGILTVKPSDSSAGDNDEIYLATSVELFKFEANVAFMVEALIQFSEVNTDDANVCFGFMSTVAAESLIDDGAGPQATGDYVLLWKVDGGTKWYAGAQSNGTATPTADTLTTRTAGQTAYQLLRVEVVCESSTEAMAYFYADGQCIASYRFTYASAAEMAAVLGVKNGTTTSETVYVDSIDYAILR